MTSSEPVPPLPAAVVALTDEFRDRIADVVGDAFASLYLYGSLAFPSPHEWRIDVDFHVLLSEPIGDRTRGQLRELRARLADRHELGRELDGYFITLADARESAPPVSQYDAAHRDDAWALHRAHLLAGRFHQIHGLDPRTVVPVPNWEELDDALQDEMSFIDEHPDASAFGVLNGCRILYSYRTRDVVLSKYQAGEWARAELPSEWTGLIDAAMRFYARAERPSDDVMLAMEAPVFIAYVKRSILATMP